MIELTRTGFFREMPHGEPGDPSLAEARNPAPGPHEDRVIAYLEAGHVHSAAPAPVRDVLDAATELGPPHSLTDGTFVWPADLAHYVRTYHVRLAGPFVEHMLAHGWTVPAEVDLATLTLPKRPAGDPDLGKAWSEFVGAAREALDSPDGAKLRAQLSEMGKAASRFFESLAPPGSERRKRISQEADLFKSTVDEVTTDATRAAGTVADEVRGTLQDAGGRVRSRLSSTLRALSDWLERPQEERTQKAESFVSSLKDKLDAAVARQREAAKPAGDKPAGSEPAGGEATKGGTDPDRGDTN